MQDEIISAKLMSGRTSRVIAYIRYNNGREENVSPEWLREQYGHIVYDRIENGFNTWVDI